MKDCWFDIGDLEYDKKCNLYFAGCFNDFIKTLSGDVEAVAAELDQVLLCYNKIRIVLVARV